MDADGLASPNRIGCGISFARPRRTYWNEQPESSVCGLQGEGPGPRGSVTFRRQWNVAKKHLAWHASSDSPDIASHSQSQTTVRAMHGTDDRMVLDDATFEAVVNAHYESLYRFAFSLAQREADARDLTQETFAQLARKAQQLQDQSKIKSWLFTTLYRTFIDSRRREQRYPHVEMEAADGELPVSTPRAGEGIDAAAALEALMQLEENFRAPLRA